MLPIGRQSLQFYNDHQFFHQLILIQYCNVATANSFIELCVENTLNCALCYVSSDGLLGGGSKGAGGVEVAHPEGGHLLPREPSAPGLGLSNRIVLSLFIRSSQVLLNSLQLFYMRKWSVQNANPYPAGILADLDAGHPGDVPNLVLLRSR